MATASTGWLDHALRKQAAIACVVVAGFCAASAFGVRFGLAAQLGLLLAGLVVIGVPHGAFDHLVARPVLYRRLGKFWWMAFAAAYVGLAGMVWLAWMAAPALTLAGFLGASVLHFGLGDSEDGFAPNSVPRPIAVLITGSLPVLLPAALHPAEAAPILAALGGISTQAMMSVLVWCFWLLPVWLMAFLWLCGAGWRNQPMIVERILTAIAFLLLPPLLAFALYFSLGHSVRHVLRLGAWFDSHDFATALRWTLRTLVPAGVVCAAGIASLCLLGQRTSVDLLVPIFRIIAALTLPHLIVTCWLDAREAA